ncbi:MAG: hypothetical protein OES13_08210 [Acidimicrobiia bacterium]|nr:hypothetical protein [Acidimicrobiia bacterium]
MDAWVWVIIIAVIIVVAVLALAFLRRSRRSGSVLAAEDREGRR